MLPSDNVGAPDPMDRAEGVTRLNRSRAVMQDTPGRTIVAFTTRQAIRLIAVQLADILAVGTEDTPQAVLDAVANAHEQLIAAGQVYRARDRQAPITLPASPGWFL